VTHEKRLADLGGPPKLLLGYAQSPEPTIGAAVAELAAAVEHGAARR
jgi:hypothetical protein